MGALPRPARLRMPRMQATETVMRTGNSVFTYQSTSSTCLQPQQEVYGFQEAMGARRPIF